jgi:hypothetical protein
MILSNTACRICTCRMPIVFANWRESASPRRCRNRCSGGLVDVEIDVNFGKSVGRRFTPGAVREIFLNGPKIGFAQSRAS